MRAAQADLAKRNGIEAFCYWHYWFGNGKRILERPFDEVLQSGQPDFPFCLCWANESWTGVWYGARRRILIEQTYPGESDQEQHFELILPALRDSRYVRVNGKPMFLVFRPEYLPDAGMFVAQWRRLALEAGLDGLFLVGMGDDQIDSESLAPFDAVTHHGPGEYLNRFPTRNIVARALRRALRGKIADFLSDTLRGLVRQPARYDYSDVVKAAFEYLPLEERFLPCVLAGWDNTPRSKHRGVVFDNFSPELFRRYLRKAIARVADHPRETRLIFIKAWNEWAEGNYLEPDMDTGMGLLDVVRGEVFPSRLSR